MTIEERNKRKIVILLISIFLLLFLNFILGSNLNGDIYNYEKDK